MWDSHERTDASDLLKGAIAGAIGGLVGTWVMTQFQTQLGRLTSSEDEGEKDGEQEDPATVQAADSVAQVVAGRRLRKREKQIAGPAVHYGFGTSMGCIYGTVVEAMPAAKAGWGMPFGAMLFAGADEVAVPALRLSDPPTETPASTHLHGLAAHLVYGLTTEMVRCAVRRVL